MRRKRGRAKSSASNPETNGVTATSPETGARRSKRSSSNAPAASKASRLHPTTPLHMTTRTASRAATNSTAPSDVSADSRRSSLADSTAHVGGFDIDAGRPAKRSRLSDRSNHSTNEHSSVTSTLLNARPATRRLKNEDSFEVPALIIDGDDASGRMLSVGPSESGNGNAIHPGREEEDVDVIRDLKPFPHPRRRGRGRRPRHAQPDLAVESANESFDQRTPARSASCANGQVVVDTDQEQPVRVIKRLPGRRRAPNPNTNIEADLRRQLQLKMGYRAVAKALKPILAELAKRTVEELDNNPEAHKRTEEYNVVMRELDQRLQSRLEILENEKKLLEEYAERWRDANEEILKEQFENMVFSCQDDYLTTSKRALLNLARDQDRDEDSDATDDEGSVDITGNKISRLMPVMDGVIPPQHNSLSSRHPTGRLDARYDSRSRVLAETDRYWERGQKRWRILTVRLKSTENDPVMNEVSQETSESFGITDYDRREKAIAKLNVLVLANAATTVEAQAKKKKETLEAKVISNDDAEALQTLALASELKLNGAELQSQEQKQTSTLPPPPPLPPPLPPPPPPAAGTIQMQWSQDPIQSVGSLQRQEPHPPIVPNTFPGVSYYDPAKSSIQPRGPDMHVGREAESAISTRVFRTNESDAHIDHSRGYYAQPEALQPRDQHYGGYQVQFNLEAPPAERATYERVTQPRLALTQKQHSRASSWEDDAMRARSVPHRGQASPGFESQKGTPHLRHQSLEEKRAPEGAGADPGTQSAGTHSPMPQVQQAEEYDRVGRVALPGQAHTYYTPPASHSPHHPPPSGHPGAAPAPPGHPVPTEHSHHRPASDFFNLQSENGRHEASKARFSHLQPARETAGPHERHTPNYIKETRVSGEGRKRSETIAGPQNTNRPSLALDTAAASDNRGHGPSTAPVHMSPTQTPTQSVSPFTLHTRPPPSSEGRMETPPNHIRNPSHGGVTSYQGYAPSPMQPVYPPTYAHPPPSYGPVAPNQPPYNVAPPYAGQPPPLPPPLLQPGYGSQPPMPQHHSPQPLFQPILPNNPPNTTMMPTYSGPQYQGTPIQPANPPTSQGGPSIVPPFGPVFSQISTSSSQTNNGHSTRGGRSRGRGASRNGETAFHMYRPPGMEQGGKS